MTETFPSTFFWVPFIGVLVVFAWKTWRNGGVRGAMFGSRVEELVGEVDGVPTALHSLRIRVHRLAGNARGETIGIELVTKSFASYQMMPIALSAEAAHEFASLLQQAVQQARKP